MFCVQLKSIVRNFTFGSRLRLDGDDGIDNTVADADDKLMIRLTASESKFLHSNWLNVSTRVKFAIQRTIDERFSLTPINSSLDAISFETNCMCAQCSSPYSASTCEHSISQLAPSPPPKQFANHQLQIFWGIPPLKLIDFSPTKKILDHIEVHWKWNYSQT